MLNLKNNILKVRDPITKEFKDFPVIGITKQYFDQWMEEHPEERANIDDGSLTKKKFSDELKKYTIKDYVTPEMYDATDDAKAIQQAINSRMSCYIPKGTTYTIKSPITLNGNKQLQIDGVLKLECSPGFIVTGSHNKITGNGSITIPYDTTESYIGIKCLIKNDTTTKEWFTYNTFDIEIKTASITNKDGNFNSHTGIEIIGETDYGCGCFNYFNCDIINLYRGIYCHKAEKQHSSSWFTQPFLDCIFDNCIIAVDFAWDCTGARISGSIQPYVSGDKHVEGSAPLCTIGEETYIDAKIWDMGTAYNQKAIKITNRNCIIDTIINKTYLDIPAAYIGNTFVVNKVSQIPVKFPVSTISQTNFFGTENDILYNFENSSKISSYSLLPDRTAIHAFRGKQVVTTYTNKKGNLSFEFDFTEGIPLKGFVAIGQVLPESIELYAKVNNSTEYEKFATLTKGKDYKDGTASAKAFGVWEYSYNRDYKILGGFDDRRVKSLKIVFILQDISLGAKDYLIDKICAFVQDTDMVKQSGSSMTGDLVFSVGKGCVLQDANKVKYRLTVGTDGTLSAVPINL